MTSPHHHSQTEDLNPHRGHSDGPQPRTLSVPSREDLKVMSLDTFSRTREGENMLVKVDAHLACTGMINAVESVLEAFRTMAIEHHSCM
jgi:hypothetical protein